MAIVRETSKKVSGTAILACSCKHDFQDKEYGKGRRVMNLCMGGARCTVCGVKANVKAGKE